MVAGVWTGDEWQAQDDRDLEAHPPIHYAYVTLPDYEGEDEDWASADQDSEEGDEGLSV